MTTMAVALSTGLLATHTFVPPTPGPIAAAGNLDADIGLVIMFGLLTAVPAVLAGYVWAVKIGSRYSIKDETVSLPEQDTGNLPGALSSFAPIIVPIALITLKSVADFPGHPFGEGRILTFFDFFGDPTVALLIGVFLSFRLIPDWSEEYINGWVSEGLRNSATIIMITAAGGAFGAVLKATEVGTYISGLLAGYQLGIFLPFIIAVAMKTAQGSSTVALITTSALVSPMLVDLGLSSESARALTVISIGAGAMIISHANDSYFWVVSQFSGMDTTTAYKSYSLATLVQGVTSIVFVYILTMIVL